MSIIFERYMGVGGPGKVGGGNSASQMKFRLDSSAYRSPYVAFFGGPQQPEELSSLASSAVELMRDCRHSLNQLSLTSKLVYVPLGLASVHLPKP
jgi:hypothetical protein